MDRTTLGLVGIVAGMVYAAMAVFYSAPDVKRVKVFQREDKPAVMRMYRVGSDGIYIADLKNEGNYIRLNQYLEGIGNEADRNIEEVTIKKVIGWYK